MGEHNPNKLDKVDEFLGRSGGREHELYVRICTKYNVKPESRFGVRPPTPLERLQQAPTAIHGAISLKFRQVVSRFKRTKQQEELAKANIQFHSRIHSMITTKLRFADTKVKDTSN